MIQTEFIPMTTTEKQIEPSVCSVNPQTELKKYKEPGPLETVESVIAQHPFLAGLTADQLRTLAGNAMRVRFEAGQSIFREGDPANRFYLIERGNVQLEAHPNDSPDVPIQTISGGDVLGWSWLFPPYYWHFDARAIEPTTAIFIYGTRLREQCENDHDLGYELMKRMAAVVIHRLQVTRKQLLTRSAGSQFRSSG
jgi:CRP/FNR family cyclic AMP-dependent transcriptional regulator